MKAQNRSALPLRERRWFSYAGSLVASSVLAWFCWRGLTIKLFDLFPPVGRSWPAAWIAVALSLMTVAGGVSLFKLRYCIAGSILIGLGAGVAAGGVFDIWLLKILPSC
jgi:hypothetical protein